MNDNSKRLTDRHPQPTIPMDFSTADREAGLLAAAAHVDAIFMVIGTLNPVDASAHERLSVETMDRFGMSIPNLSPGEILLLGAHLDHYAHSDHHPLVGVLSLDEDLYPDYHKPEDSYAGELFCQRVKRLNALSLTPDVVNNAITENDMLDFNTRCFTTIAGSFKGVNERIVREIDLLEKRDFNVSAYRDGLMAVIAASQPFAGLMVTGGQVAVDADIRAAIDNTFSMQHELDGQIRTANWFLDELAVANKRFTAHSAIAPRKLKIADESKSSSVLAGFISFAADPSEVKQSSLAALNELKSHVEKRDMVAANKALTTGRAFSSRMHMCNAVVDRGALVVAES